MDEYDESMEFPTPPPDERWWERELLRNEKLIDKYMQVLGDHPDWDKFQSSSELYETAPVGSGISDDEEEVDEEDYELDEIAEEALELEEEVSDGLDDDEGLEDEAIDEEHAEDEGYAEVARQARDFAIRVFQIDELPESADVFLLSAGKIGANLAGGHGIGYEDESICGNIVKCRWAFADCEFCREMLEQFIEKTGRAEFESLLEECVTLAGAIRERVERLRMRVWW